jgi:RNA polymerase subunit RPABC4/transcription elongation factor Spt4
MIERACHTCRHRDLPESEDPCDYCSSFKNYVSWAQEVPVYPCTADELADELILDAASAPDPKAYIADEAKRIVTGARRGAYGKPGNNFARIALFWQAYFHATGREISVTAADVSPLMRLMKEARLCETPDHLDSHIDLVGYTLTGAEVAGVKIPLDGA